MKINNISFPHPVLGVHDDVQGLHSVEVGLTSSQETVVITVKHAFFNKTIEDLIRTKKASFCVQIICPQTYFRRFYFSREKDQEIRIPHDELRNKVTVEFFVIAERDIPDYENDRAHPDYSGFKFQVEKGDVLSYGGRFSFVADKQWMSNKSVSSFMAIVCGDREKGPIEVDLDNPSEKIIVALPKKDFERFKENARNDVLYPVYHSSIVFPALMYALNQMVTKEGREQYEDRMWFQVLEEKKRSDAELSGIGWEVSNIAEIAQIILKNPVTRVFDSIGALTADEDEG